ncbi:adenylate/guanylate cyclase domain-containing protein [Arenibacter certesii]|uniref:Adenylate cyclase n=1 Tax=Arenibacter certesii TaxID=228955 RepID=A0A918J2V4_9FLAO|nr:adenylate/guanylate cyclase domain-containing protein [Arenibacter certesii]GGW44444.1 hypothetical protein GCM10007383_31110 [Arenibacter certesii]
MTTIKKLAYVTIGFFCFSICFSFGQDQKLADSLILEYNSKSHGDNDLEILSRITVEETNPDKIIAFSEMLIAKAAEDSLYNYLYQGYLQKGNAHQFKGNNVEALTAYFKSLNFARRTNDEIGFGTLMITIADTYSIMDNSKNAQEYYNRGIKLLRKLGDSSKIATALLNAGDDYFTSGKLDSAFIYTKEAEVIFENIVHSTGQAYSLGNLGMINAELENDSQAEEEISKAIAILEELEDYYPISIYLTYMSDIYSRKNKFSTALTYAKRSLELASLYGLKDQISDANLTLSELYERYGDYESSHRYYKEHIVYRDSVKNIEAIEQMADQRTTFEVSQKQIEVDLLDQRRKNQRNIAIATAVALLLIGILALGLYRRNRYIKKTKQIIELERDRSDKLLLNILPGETAQELKENGSVKAKKYESVTVLFTDFKGFTSYSEKLSPEALVDTVNFYFSRFDEIIEKHGLEKIKTIGDAYMCAGGLHPHTEDHAHRMVLAALEIVDFVAKVKENASATSMNFDIRIGINTGPVVAGVVGTKKFAYDIWGDTVNVASRMESMSESGRINISEITYSMIKDYFNCEPRGEINVKNRGPVRMYFVNGIKMDIV